MAEEREADAEDGCISLSWMLQSLLEKLSRDSLIQVFLDCCRENPLKARGMRSRGARSFGQGLADIKLSSSEEARIMVCYAAAPGKYALEGKQQHGVFTDALLKALRDDAIAQKDIRSAFFGSVADFVEQTEKRQRPEFRTNMLKGFAFQGE